MLWTRPPVGIPLILYKQEKGAYCLFLDLSAPKQNHPEKQLTHRHPGPAFQLLDVDGGDWVDFNKFEATRVSLQHPERKT